MFPNSNYENHESSEKTYKNHLLFHPLEIMAVKISVWALVGMIPWLERHPIN